MPKMRNIEVYIGSEGDVVLSQEWDFQEPEVIILHPEQIEIVVKWMRKTKAEIFRGE